MKKLKRYKAGFAKSYPVFSTKRGDFSSMKIRSTPNSKVCRIETAAILHSHIIKLVRRFSVVSSVLDGTRYFPKLNEHYWYYSYSSGVVIQCEYDASTFDYNNIAIGNCFMTKEEALATRHELMKFYKRIANACA